MYPKRTTSIIWKSDFKDFKGLHEATMCMNRLETCKNFVVIENWPGNRTPFDILSNEEKNGTSHLKDNDFYSNVLEMATEFGFNVSAAKERMDNLEVSSKTLYRRMQSAICYPENHANRHICL